MWSVQPVGPLEVDVVLEPVEVLAVDEPPAPPMPPDPSPSITAVPPQAVSELKRRTKAALRMPMV